VYTYQKKIVALQKYEETQSITTTICALGYPSRETLYNWINQNGQPPKEKSAFRGVNTQEHPRHPSVELKLEVLHRCFELGEDVKSVSDEIGYSRASIYAWRRKYIQRGTIALMNPTDDPRGKLAEGFASSSEEIDAMRAKMQDMQMQIDILKETINVLKKDPGVDQTALRNREKAVIIDALKSKYSLPKLVVALNCSRSSYYYQRKAMCRADKYWSVRDHIKEVFEDNHGRYGYRRIHAFLAKEGKRLSEKVVRRLMKYDGLAVLARRKRRYSSYKGEITPAVPNILKRNFHADKPNEKWLTDITEFAIPAGRLSFANH
jgi:transposase-like protein